jgi:hypothetical protein
LTQNEKVSSDHNFIIDHGMAITFLSKFKFWIQKILIS